MEIKSICLVIASLLLSKILIAQEFYFKHHTVENGLSNNTVISTTQDRYGFMWFGTRDGLNRFDGYNFKIFRKNTNDSTSLTSSSISSLHCDEKNTLWVGTEKGLCEYLRTSESFAVIKGTEGKAIQKIVSIGSVLWFIADFSLYRYNLTKKKLENISAFYKFYDMSALGVDNNNNIWIGTVNGQLARYEKKKYTFSRFNVFAPKLKANSYEITAIEDDGFGNMLVGTFSSGLIIFSKKNKNFENLIGNRGNKSELFIRKILKTTDREFWIGTEDGVFIYKGKDSIQHLEKKMNDPFSLSNNAVYDLYKDKEGGIWVTTYFGGINYKPHASLGIQRYFPIANQNSISGSAVREIVQDKNKNLWIGTEDAGLNKFNPITKTFKNFIPGDGSGISYSNIHGLVIDGTKLWIGTFENGLDVMDINTEKIIKHYGSVTASEKLGLKSSFIHSILNSSQNKILLSTSNGFYEYDRAIDNFRLFENLPFNTFYTSIAEDENGTIWVGTFTSGVLFTSPDRKIFGSLKIISKNINKLLQTRVVYIKFDSKQNLWICTEDGLYKVNKAKNKVTMFNTQNGFPSNLFYAVAEDKEGNIWVTTSKGLVRIDNNTERIRTFSQADNLLGDQFNYSSAFIDSSNNIYFGSVKGLISFNASNYKPTNFPTPLFITDFELAQPKSQHQNKLLMQQIKSNQPLIIPHYQSTFSIGFSALHFSAPENVDYAYKLDGLDEDWNYVKNDRQVNFSNLPAGTYKFIIKSTNGEGVWLQNDKTLVIKILPPWWLTPAAKLIYILGALALVILIFNRYSNRQKMLQKKKMQAFEARKQRELYDTKLDFFTKLAHEIKTPLTLIKAPMDKIMKSADLTPKTEKNLNTMSRNTDRLLELSKQLLDFRKVESDQAAIHFTKINLIEKINHNILDFTDLAENNNIKIHFLPGKSNCNIMADEDSIKKIISNLISNAIKYGESQLAISISQQNNSVFIKFMNDGELVPTKLKNEIFKPFFRVHENDQAGGTGIGLSLAKSLTELHNGSLEFSIENNLNTFTLILPLNY